MIYLEVLYYVSVFQKIILKLNTYTIKLCTKFEENPSFFIFLGLILIGCCITLDYVDLSILYHIVRGQSVIKLYVIYNMLDVSELWQITELCIMYWDILKPFMLFNILL